MLSEPTKLRRATTITEVVDIMEMLDRELSDADGVWWFNRLYLRETHAVRSAVTTTTFRDPAFLERRRVSRTCISTPSPPATLIRDRAVFECRRRPFTTSGCARERQLR